MSSNDRSSVPPGRDLPLEFEAVLPRIQLHAQIAFRHFRCSHDREELVAETIALCWKWYVRLAERGKDAREFITTLATFAVRAVKSGRRLCGQESPKDPFTSVTHYRHGVVLQRLSGTTQQPSDLLAESLCDNSHTPVPDQVCFRIDLPAWIGTRSERDSRLINDMMKSERTLDLAHKYGLSPARISQLRKELHADWEAFCRDPVEEVEEALTC